MAVVLPVALKSLAAVVALFLLARLLGKKQISQLSFFDYVAGISIGSIASSVAVDDSIGFAQGLTGMVVFAAFSILLNIVDLKSYAARKLLEGKPSILIQHGKILERNLKRSRLSVNDLLEECRLKGVFDLDDVDYAVFETKGELSVLLKPQRQPLTPGDMNVPVARPGLCTNLVVDGRVLRGNLDLLCRDERWLNGELSKLGFTGPDAVLLCSVDETGKVYACEKGGAEPPPPLM